jgi:hypothetical protein
VGPGRNVATWLRVAPMFNTTRAVFDAAGLSAKTQDNALVATLFLPTEGAWDAFLDAAKLSREALLGNAGLAAKLARNHIVPHVRTPMPPFVAHCCLLA